MRKLLCLLIGVSLVSAAFAAEEPLLSRYRFTPPQSRVMFSMKHLGVVTMAGDFREFTGVFLFDPDRIEETRVNLNIKTASADAGNPGQTRRLRSQKFFWPEKHPEIKFDSREIKNVRGAEFDIHGDLTIRGVTVPVVFETKLISDPRTPPDQPMRFLTQTYIKRTDFKLGTGEWNPLMIVNEILLISLAVEGIPAKTG